MRPIDVLTATEHIEPETIRQLMSLSNHDVEKTLVLDVIKNTNAVFEDMYVFENACLVLNGLTPDVTKIEGVLPYFLWTA
ncbi:MAG: hypothetical protein H8E12_07730 [Rhodobacteraceae bacterium]|nr:hypothetical protein [Paracoccaceae bacterium]